MKNSLFHVPAGSYFSIITVFYNFQDNIYFHQALRFPVQCN